MKTVRCAIYTRKSSEEGLEQDFNSLHAQREACSAYILSQASEGWSLLPEVYDDGGLSGGNLERPALQRLLADVTAGRIDIIVVYKVDRLTRSLLDFARLVEAFDAAGTSFVSVTQSFNTTTSMGRLTLNMLLSFAQFEREVTAERIRDKIAASKARGMWMGGNVPLGYAPDGRTLAIVEEHATLIRQIFARYLELGNVRVLAEQLERDGVRVPTRTASTGRAMGGCAFTRGQIYKILSNPIYIGEIHHKGQVHQGKHPPIVERDIWDQVQQMLADNTQGSRTGARSTIPSPLAGLVCDEAGETLVASHASKRKVRYRYYVSKALQTAKDTSDTSGIRIPALELEKVVAEGLAAAFEDPLGLIQRANLQPRAEQLAALSATAEAIAGKLRKRDRASLRQLIERVQVLPERIRVEFSTTALAQMLGLDRPVGSPGAIAISLDARIRRSGLAVKLVQGNGQLATPAEPQQHLVTLLARARSWWNEMVGEGLTASQLAARHKVTSSYVSRMLRLNFLAPQIVEKIIAGEQPPALDGVRLMGLNDLPLSWAAQKQILQIA
jgi:DNA invertase Pin-like site-specific DNA recombinase